jgi:glycine betaine catabolism B
MIVTIHGRLRDTISFIAPFRERAKRFKSASPSPKQPGAMNTLAESLHPAWLDLVVESSRAESGTSVTFRLVPALASTRIPPFRAGQYIAVRLRIGGATVSRPYSISSSPDEALEGNYYEITVKASQKGFCAPYILEHWKDGTAVRCSAPAGTFYHEPLRDGARVVCLAGGSGITPFRSIIIDSLAHDTTSFTLFHGVSCPDELLFLDEFEDLAARYPGRLHLVPVCADPDDGWDGARGFLSADILRANTPDHGKATYFISGPDAMKDYLERQMAGWGLKPRQVRQERSAGAVEPSAFDGYPGTAPGSSFRLTAHIDGESFSVPALAGETVLTALERAGLNPPSLCRSGECGWCRSLLVSGECFTPPGGNGVRAADIASGHFHPCRSYPLSDIDMEMPRNPEQEKEHAT